MKYAYMFIKATFKVSNKKTKKEKKKVNLKVLKLEIMYQSIPLFLNITIVDL